MVVCVCCLWLYMHISVFWQVDKEIASGEYFLKEHERKQRKRQLKLVRLLSLFVSLFVSVIVSLFVSLFVSVFVFLPVCLCFSVSGLRLDMHCCPCLQCFDTVGWVAGRASGM